MNEILKQLLNVIYSRTQLRAAALKLQDQMASQARPYWMQLTSDKAYVLRLKKRAQAGLIRGCYSRELARSS